MASSKAERQLLEAKSALRHGELERARVILAGLVKTDRSNPEVWLWLSSVVDTKKERKVCLEQVLKYDPDHPTARRALASLGEEAYREKARIPYREQVRDWEKDLAIPKFSRFQQMMMSGIWRPILMITGIVLILAILGFGGWGISRWINRPTVSLGILNTSTPSPSATNRPHEYLFFNLDELNKETPLPEIIKLTATLAPTQTPYVKLQFSQYEYNRSAMYAYNNQDWEAMEENLLALIEEEPEAYDAYYYLGIAYLHQERISEARTQFNQALQLNADFAPAYVGLARVIMAQQIKGQYEQAQENLDTAYEIDPNMVEIQLVAADLNNLMGNPRDALVNLRKADRLQPDNVDIMLKFAETYRLLELPSMTLEYLLKAQAIDGTRLDIYRQLGELYFKDGEYSKALEPLRIYLVYAEDIAPQYWAWVGACYSEIGRDEDAEEAFDKAQSLSPNDPEIQYLIGDFFRQYGDYEEALTNMKAAVARQPRSYTYNFGLAQLYAEMDDCGKSIYYFNQAEAYAETDWETADVYYFRGQCHYELGNVNTANADMRDLLTLELELDDEWLAFAEDHLGIVPTETPTLTLTATFTVTVTPTQTITPTLTTTPTVTVTPTVTGTPED